MAKYKAALPTIPERGYFEKGDKGAEVEKLQKALNWANNGTIVAPLKIDGEVGPLTINAVNFFEEIQHLTIDGQFGPKCRARLAKMDLTGAIKACNWAVSVAKDNRFTYGAGTRAHRSGCYFCQTNVGPRKKKKEKKGEPHVVYDSKGNGHTYTMTYCCNTFITAAYAHGAKDKIIYDICHKGSCCGMEAKDWTRSPNFKSMGKAEKLEFDKLKAGDVIINLGNSGIAGHAWMYLGADRYVEATSLGGADKSWSADAIRSKAGAKANYNRYIKKDKTTTVVRYTK